MTKPTLVLLTLAITSCGETVQYEVRERPREPEELLTTVSGDDALSEASPSNGAETGSGEGSVPAGLDCQNGKVEQLEEAIYFPELALGQTCKFGTAPHLSRVNGLFRAYDQQRHSVAWPEGARLCSFSLQHDTAALRYDDEMFFTVNGWLLLATKDYTDYFTSDKGFVAFDWSRLVNQSYDPTDPRDVYCLGAELGLSRCQVPPTETQGKIELDFAPEVQEELAAMLEGAKRLDFDWITTGDNDDSDCRHSDLRFTLRLTYVRP